MKNKNGVRIIFFFTLILFFCCKSACADTKQWSGSADLSSWDKDNNWFSTGVPTTSDDVIINGKSDNVLISNTSKVFQAKTIAVGGRQSSILTASNFVDGLISPAATTDIGLYIKKNGLVVLEGAGTIKIKGSYKNTEDTVPDEPAFVFKVQ